MPIAHQPVFIGLGSNIEPRQDYIHQAIASIGEKHQVVQVADCIETEPWGFEAACLFLNTVIEIATTYSPRELLLHLQEIEKALGRTHKSTNKNYSSRTVDLDILYFGKEILVSPELIIPHPELYKRTFVLEPLNQIAPTFKDPMKMKTVGELLEACMEQ
jgi:2-amino-4-hydroxy-6-hydroxymethyldihydropteridine diphosphokinase